MNLPAKITSTMAVQVFSNCVDLYNNILQYRAATMQLQTQREQMHHEANTIEMKIKADLLKDITYIKTLAESFNLTLQQLGSKSLNMSSTLQQMEKQEHNLWKIYYSPSSKEEKTLALTMIDKLSEQRSFLMKDYLVSDNHEISIAFNTFAHHLSSQHFGGKTIDI